MSCCFVIWKKSEIYSYKVCYGKFDKVFFLQIKYILVQQMNIALIHLGHKGGTYHYSKSHIKYLDPKLIVCDGKFKNDFSHVYPNQSMVGLTTYSNLIELLFSSLFTPFYLFILF